MTYSYEQILIKKVLLAWANNRNVNATVLKLVSLTGKIHSAKEGHENQTLTALEVNAEDNVIQVTLDMIGGINRK